MIYFTLSLNKFTNLLFSKSIFMILSYNTSIIYDEYFKFLRLLRSFIIIIYSESYTNLFSIHVKHSFIIS